MNAVRWRGTWMLPVLAVVLVLFLVQAGAVSPVAGWIPFTVLGLTLMLFLVEVVREFRAPPATRRPGTERQGLASALMWIGVLVIAVLMAGVAIGAAVFSLCFLRWRSGESWWLSLGIAGGLGLFIHLVFHELLGAVLYAGLWSGI